ncbi:major facilitator superfamily domain-containing protein [Pseudomassariella vexata]|uniref:Major facilitator superfamily domain-containing protein n=1 Tax=Pseudomassariella vexata TaxID=1141098 RepID=A0A1Y2DWG0_9PEZI|nr:major facilitator superfamily domain-containing protein [Pseudomassariella vexata]ORY63444.1 major facilitator superfamily domain-containing protein [Pseudomassariella vexata]
MTPRRPVCQDVSDNEVTRTSSRLDISPSSDDDSDGDRDGEPRTLTRPKSTVSVAETLPWYRELLFVIIICLAQLFTQAGLGQAIAILHVIGDNWGIANSGDLSWFISGYSLTVGTFILFAGRLGDVFGYKKIFLIGMGWYSFWSMVAGLAVYSSYVLFIFARVLQGLGPSLALPNGLAILGATYAPGRKKSLAFAAFAATAPGGAVIGSAFAGLFSLKWWPWTFWSFSIALAMTTAVGWYAIPDAPSSDRDEQPPDFWGKVHHLDVPGAFVGVTGLILINFAWNQAPIVGWKMPYVYVCLIIGIIFVIGFFVIENHYSAKPLIPFEALSSDVSFVLGAVACGWSCFGIWLWYTWQFFEESRGASPLLATAWFCPVAISGAMAAGLVGLLLHRIGPPLVMTGALAAFTVGTILMATCPVDQIYWGQSFVALIIMPWGMDMSFPAATLILSNAVARKHQGIAASLVNTVVNYSIALGLGFAGTVEYNVNNGGKTPEDRLKGYRSAYYMGIGLAGLGVCVCIAYLIKSNRTPKRQVEEKA